MLSKFFFTTLFINYTKPTSTFTSELIRGIVKTTITTLPAISSFVAILLCPASIHTFLPNSTIYAIPITLIIINKNQY